MLAVTQNKTDVRKLMLEWRGQISWKHKMKN